jgi:hypothetical protein
MTIDESTIVASAPTAEPTNQPEPATSEGRWAAWEAKGAAHDRALRRKTAIAAPILIVVAAVVIYALLGR